MIFVTAFPSMYRNIRGHLIVWLSKVYGWKAHVPRYHRYFSCQQKINSGCHSWMQLGMAHYILRWTTR